MKTIDLTEHFGRKYRIAMEEGYYAQYGPRARVDDPHYQIIPGARGHVYAWDSERLAASTNTPGSTATKLKALPYAEIWQDGSDGSTVLFPPDHLNEVAGLLKLRLRRQVTDQDRRRLSELGRRHRFQRRSTVELPSGDGGQVDSEARFGVSGAQPAQIHLPA